MKRLALACSILFSLTPALIGAQPVIDAPLVYGSGVDLLQFEEAPDEYGLVWTIHEPNRIHEPWAVTVLNSGEQTLSNVRVTLEVQIDSQWYLLNQHVDDRILLPFTIEPGGVAMTDAGSMGGNDDWDDVRLTVTSIDTGESESGAALPLSGIEETRDGYTATVTNNTGREMDGPSIYAACVDGRGRIVDYKNGFSDLRIFAPGETEQIKTQSIYGRCESGTEPMIAAASVYRD